MDFLEFAQTITRLKKIPRTGWVKWSVPNPESVADHHFLVVVLSLFLAKKVGVDEEKALKMAIIHDLGESIIGDLITVGKFKNTKLAEKATREKEAIKKVLTLGEKPEYIQLFEEFWENQTPEAKFVHQIDKLEMLLQAEEYENEYAVDLENFFETSKRTITIDYLKKLLDEIKKLRPKK